MLFELYVILYTVNLFEIINIVISRVSSNYSLYNADAKTLKKQVLIKDHALVK
jgi:hypothetical protein